MPENLRVRMFFEPISFYFSEGKRWFIWIIIVYTAHIFEEQLSSAEELLEKVSAIRTLKLVLSFKDKKREMTFLKRKLKLMLLLHCKKILAMKNDLGMHWENYKVLQGKNHQNLQLRKTYPCSKIWSENSWR